jgi:hypothetical protein
MLPAVVLATRFTAGQQQALPSHSRVILSLVHLLNRHGKFSCTTGLLVAE